MKYRLKYLFLFLFVSFFLKGQINLVPNPSFEDTIGDCQSVMGITNFGSKVKKWYTPSYYNSVDYYNICSNSISYPHWSTIPYNAHCYQLPHSGSAYTGIYNYIISDPIDSSKIDVEYVSVKLKKKLTPNKCYYGEMYINLGNIGEIAVNQMSMLFTQNTFTTSQFSYTNTIQPQIQWDTTKYFMDTLNWIKISGKFIAQGGEQYLTIGNFKDGLHTKKTYVGTNFIPGFASWPNPKFYSYMLIDDVALYEIPTPQLQSNAITICPNSDTLILGDTARIQTNYQWFANGVATYTTSFIKVKPNQTTTYVLQSTNCSTTTQTIVVTYSNNCEPVVVVEPIIPNVFTPNNDSINDTWRFNLGKGNTLKDMSIFNRWGNHVYQKTNNLSQTTILWDGKTTSGEETTSGVYFYILQYTDANGDEHKKNGYISLMR
jgi:gliding motility-associated-like protein